MTGYMLSVHLGSQTPVRVVAIDGRIVVLHPGQSVRVG